MVTTCERGTGRRVRMMALHGISRDAWKRYTAEGSWYYQILRPGFKYNLTDVAAAVGLRNCSASGVSRGVGAGSQSAISKRSPT